MFAAGGGTIQALYNAPSQIKKGEASKLQLLPVGIRRLIGAVDDSGTVDASGQRVIDPTQAEKMMMMVGFKPKRLTDLQNQRQMLKGVTEQQTKEDALVKKKLAEQLIAGDVPGVLTGVQEQVMEEMKYLMSKGMPSGRVREEQQRLVRERLLDLVDYTVQKTLPVDPMMSGSARSAEEREKTARGYGKMLPRVSEVARQQLKQELMSQMGLGRMMPKSVMKARKADEVMQQHPYVDRPSAIKVSGM
jgi:YesN/AraC family two-component response regulator